MSAARVVTHRVSRAARQMADAFTIHRTDRDLDGLDEEIAFHLERLETDLIATGLSEEDARREALRRFGPPARARRRTVRTIRKERHMLRIAVLLTALTATGAATFGARQSLSLSPDWARVAPFTGLHVLGEGRIEIRHQGEWWALDSIEGVSASDLHAVAAGVFGADRAEKRLAEDISEVLTAAGAAPGGTVDLVLRPVAGGPAVVFPGVAMTESNRRAAWQERHPNAAGAGGAGMAPGAHLGGDPWRRVAPFAALELNADRTMDVLVGGAWHRLVAVDGVPAETLVHTAEVTFGPRLTPKRLSEDLHEVLAAATGEEPGASVRLTLLNAGGEVVEIAEAPMTHELGRAAREHNRSN